MSKGFLLYVDMLQNREIHCCGWQFKIEKGESGEQVGRNNVNSLLQASGPLIESSCLGFNSVSTSRVMGSGLYFYRFDS